VILKLFFPKVKSKRIHFEFSYSNRQKTNKKTNQQGAYDRITIQHQQPSPEKN
jgi:hypothetical protein